MDVRIELCYDYMPTWLLKRILRNDLMNKKNPFLTDEAINHICDILMDPLPYDGEWYAEQVFISKTNLRITSPMMT